MTPGPQIRATGGAPEKVSDPHALAELRSATASIWSEDAENGWPEWDAYIDETEPGKSGVLWPDGDAFVTIYSSCNHQHGDGGWARFIAAAQPRVIVDLMADLDRLHSENRLLRAIHVQETTL